jgi:acetolactate synthase-1/3 small subunit
MMPAMSDSSNDFVMRHVIAALVTNEPGVLAQVAGMFAARGFNIDSLVVGRTENPELSRMTIVTTGDSAVLEQVRKQLQKLVPVVKVVDYQDVAYVERDLVLVQVSTKPKAAPAPGPGSGGASGGGDADKREEIITLANLFRARIVDVATDQVMIEIAGTEEKLEAFLQLVEPYGIVELARTGVIAMRRGNASAFRRVALSKAVSAGGAGSEGPGIDAADLPPG